MIRWTAAIFALAVMWTSCGGVQSAINPAGPQAARIAGLWWTMLAVGTLVLLGVTVLAIAAAGLAGERPRRTWNDSKGKRLVIAGGLVTPVIVLFGLLVYSVLVGRAAVTEPDEIDLQVEVVGHQWWWEVHYLDRDGNPLARTANEIHIPTGRPVRFLLKSRDVIHSFWAPNLHGKTDLIPGRTNRTWLQADRPGEYRGQCAEFCGTQHALMAFLVIAQAPAAFEAWLRHQSRPAAEPVTDEQRRGRDIFLSSSCVMCHSIRGTDALGSVAPDLTHVGSRRRLAAGTIPNGRGHLGGWILDPQRIKPGTRMPPTNLDSESVSPLLAYLENLQ